MTVEPEMRPDTTALGVDIGTILDRLGDGVTVQGSNGELLYANAAGARLCGFDSPEQLLRATPEEVVARFDLYDANGAPFPISALPGRMALQGEQPPEVLIRVRERNTGAARWSLVEAFAVRGASGEIAYAVNVFRDVTERTEATARAELLNDVAGVLAEATDADAGVDQIFETVGRALGWELAVLLRVDEAGAKLRFDRVWRGSDLDLDAFERGLAERTFSRGSGMPGRVWATGETEWVEDVGGARDVPAGPGAAQAGLRSSVAFPLLLAGDVAGVVQFFCRGPRPAQPDLEPTLAAIGSQLGLFLERMRAAGERERLLRSERAARASAEEVANTLGKLEEVTEAALRHVASGDVLQELLTQIARLVEADTSAILLLDDERRFLTMRAAIGFDRELEHAVPIPYGQGMAGRVAATRTPVVIGDLDQVELASPHLRERGIRSLVAIPITISDQVIGVAHAGSVEPSHFDEDDMRLLRLMADRLALAISQSQLYEDERTARREAELAHRRLSFLAEASTLLASSLDYESTLRAVARLAVPHLADWCVIDVADEEGILSRIATAHVDAAKVSLVRELERRWPPQQDAPFGPYAVLRSGTPELSPEITEDLLRAAAQDEEHLAVIREIGLRSYMTVPMWGRDHVLGVLSLVTAESERSYTEADLALAEELARRAAVAVENALLYRQAEDRARAARVLDAVGDGVFLVDSRGMIELWNPAAEAITGLAEEEVVGRSVAVAVPGWVEIAPRVPVVAEHDRAAARAETVPLEIGDRELWLSMSGVGFVDGTVYAFRDLTQDRVLEELKAEFVSTVSHELRTPLAAIYGAAMTLRRRDFAVEEGQREKLLGVIAQESERLATIVNDILWASRLDAQSMQFSIQSCDAVPLAQGVVDAADAHLPVGIELVLRAPDELPRVAGDPDKIRQVLVNLLDNGIKYSPDGGRVVVELSAGETSLRFAVHDEGLGVPPTEQRRIFEKFYRLDPNLTRGVGGTGLGLYICRELVHRMNGRLWVVSPRENGRGSTFSFELPLAAHQS